MLASHLRIDYTSRRSCGSMVAAAAVVLLVPRGVDNTRRKLPT